MTGKIVRHLSSDKIGHFCQSCVIGYSNSYVPISSYRLLLKHVLVTGRFELCRSDHMFSLTIIRASQNMFGHVFTVIYRNHYCR